MKLQLALDMLATTDALRVAALAAPYVDILEVGTPLLKHAGIEVVRLLRALHPDKELLVDLKTMDAGEYEATPFLAAGADLVTVLGAADDRTIAGVQAAAERHGRKVVVDLINAADPVARAREVSALGVHFVGVHSGIDQQRAGGSPLEVLRRVRRGVETQVSVAGGINDATIAAIAAEAPAIIVVGGGITGAANPRAAAASLRAAMKATGETLASVFA